MPNPKQQSSSNPLPSRSELPEGLVEFPNSVPPQATGAGKRFHKCSDCGWVEGAPVLEPQNDPWPNQGSRQPQTLHRCRRCNKVLAKTGDFQGGRVAT